MEQSPQDCRSDSDEHEHEHLYTDHESDGELEHFGGRLRPLSHKAT